MTPKSKKQKPKAAKAKPSPQRTAKSLPQSSKTFVLFGLDEEDKPRAAKFAGANEQVITKLAQTLGLRVGVVKGKEHAELVGKLPIGNLHTPGNAAVLNIDPELYERLNVAVGGDTGRISTVFPKSWDEIAPGHLVIAHENPDDGWWEAIVVGTEGDMLTLQFRDFPSLPKFVRHRLSVALIKPPEA